MAILTLTFDTGAVSVASIVNDLADVNGYQATVPDPGNPGFTMPNPQTKAQFARECVRQYIIRTVRDYRRNNATVTAVTGVPDPTIT